MREASQVLSTINHSDNRCTNPSQYLYSNFQCSEKFFLESYEFDKIYVCRNISVYHRQNSIAVPPISNFTTELQSFIELASQEMTGRLTITVQVLKQILSITEEIDRLQAFLTENVLLFKSLRSLGVEYKRAKRENLAKSDETTITNEQQTQVQNHPNAIDSQDPSINKAEYEMFQTMDDLQIDIDKGA